MKVNRKLVAGAVAGLAVAGGGAAVAATQFGDPKAENEAIIKDAAGQLGVQPSALSDALKKAFMNRIDAAVAAGRLTKEQGDAIKARIQSSAYPPVFGGRQGPGGFDHDGHDGVRGLDAAAKYLGLSESDLRTKLDNGKSLADVAKDQGKSVDGLIQALVADAKTHLDQAVSDGRLTQAQENQILSQIKEHLSDFVNGKAPEGFGPRFRGGPGFPGPGGPPAFRGGTGPGGGSDTGWGSAA
jgi:hypothetical protein